VKKKKENFFRLDHKNSMFNISLSLGQKIMKSPPRNPTSQGFSKLAKNDLISIRKLVFIFFWVFFEKIVQFSTTRLHYKFKQYECTSKHPYPRIKGFPTISIKSVVGNASGGHFHFIWNNVQKKRDATCWKKVQFEISLNVNRMFIIHHKNTFKIYLIYF